MNIIEALAALDSDNDDHWTGNNLPKVDAIKEMTGDPEITRSVIDMAAPDYTRDNRYDLPDAEAVDETDDEDPELAVDPEDPGDMPGDEPIDDEPEEDPADADVIDGKREAAAAEIEKVRQNIAEMTAQKNDLEAAIKDRSAALEAAENLYNSMFPPLSAAEVTKQYQQRSLEERKKASAARQAARIGHNVKTSRLAGVSPLDQAYAVRRTSGRARTRTPSKLAGSQQV